MRFVLIVGLLTSLFLLFPPSPARASSLSSTSYTYDKVGNIQTMNNTVDTTKSLSYSYDDIYRLERVSGGYSAGYGYDADGNILTKNEDQNLTLTYIPSDSVASHGPKSVNGRLLRYDLDGNLIEDAFSNLKIVYDYDNRPVEIRRLDSNLLLAKYFYDGEGKRVKKEVYANNTLSKTTYYINQYYEKEQPVGGTLVVRKFYSGAAYRESQLTTNNTQLTTNLFYTTTDHLSSTTLTTNTQGQKIAHYVYYPYGSPNLQLTTNLPAMLRPLAAMQRLRASIAMQAGNSQPLPNSWIGQKRDTESNLYFLNARYYSPTMGRFVSVDSVEDPVTRGNKYSYVGENPMLRNDPAGTGCAADNMEECRNIWNKENPWPTFDSQRYKTLLSLGLYDEVFDLQTQYFYQTLDVGFARDDLRRESFTRASQILKDLFNTAVVYENLGGPSKTSESMQLTGENQLAALATSSHETPLRSLFISNQGYISFNTNYYNKEQNDDINTLGHEATHIFDRIHMSESENQKYRMNMILTGKDEFSSLTEIHAYGFEKSIGNRFSTNKDYQTTVETYYNAFTSMYNQDHQYIQNFWSNLFNNTK